MNVLMNLLHSETFLRHRRSFIVAFHGAAVALCYFAAFELRFDFSLPPAERLRIIQTLGFLLGVKLLVYWRYRLYDGWWAYPSFSDLRNIVAANSVASCLFMVATFLSKTATGMSRSVLLMDCILAIALLSGTRFLVMALKQASSEPRRIEKYVLIVGAGEAGVRLLQEIEGNPRLGVYVVGLVDDDRAKWGMRIHGIHVLGGTKKIAELVEKHRVQEVILAVPSAASEDLQRIVRICQSTGVACKVLPPMAALIDGKIHYRMARDVKLEDLLARKPVRLDREAVRQHLAGSVVLVTGGAGSIGSELVREISQYAVKQIVVLDRNENALFLLEMEIRAQHPELDLAFVVADIQDPRRLQNVFRRFAPDCVFHAAAYKHVPLMENNALEAVKNNVFGTRNVLEAARAAGTREFVLISTDKAIRPSSVMGATKRMAEMILQRWPDSPRCVAVRFGNVLGSAGSVVNVFREQIGRGEAVTVTHPDATRYFMTAQEAVQLILQAVTLGRGGELFILNMGEAVKIVDLARNLIRLSGLEPDVDIPLRFTGLRPGEKLHETLWHEDERIEKTVHEKIWMLRNHQPSSLDLPALLAELRAASNASDQQRIVDLLHQAVTEYEPSAVASSLSLTASA
jgi:FlaA1/EpsC-like NDP-sugar epimerase